MGRDNWVWTYLKKSEENKIIPDTVTTDSTGITNKEIVDREMEKLTKNVSMNSRKHNENDTKDNKS